MVSLRLPGLKAALGMEDIKYYWPYGLTTLNEPKSKGVATNCRARHNLLLALCKRLNGTGIWGDETMCV